MQTNDYVLRTAAATDDIVSNVLLQLTETAAMSGMMSTLTESAQTFRGQSAQSLRTSNDETFMLLSTIRECMDHQDSQQLRDIVMDDQYKGLVEYIAWDLLPILGPYLSDKEENQGMYDNCIDIMGQLSKLGNPKEMFIGLLEQMDRFRDNLIHSDFLQPLQTVMKRLGLTKPLYYKQLLTTLYAHVDILKLPSLEGMGAIERRLVSQDPDYSKVQTATLALLEFLAPLVYDIRKALVMNVEEQSYTPKDIADIGNTRTEMMKFILSLLEHPLVAMEFKYLHDVDDEEAELEQLGALQGMSDKNRQQIAHRSDDYSTSKTSAEQCMFFLDSMGCSFTYLLFYASQNPMNLDTMVEQRRREARRKRLEEDGEDDDADGGRDESLPVLGLSCFAYMILAIEYETLSMPTVYSAVHMMHVAMPYVEAMLRRTEQPIIIKGLELLTSLVCRLEEHSLHSSLIDTRQSFLKVPECLVQIMIYCSYKPIRKMSISLLPNYIDVFDWKGRYHLLRSLLMTTEHSGVRGLLVGKVKDCVHCSLQGDCRNGWFLGSRLYHLYSMIFRPDQEPNSDLLDTLDKEIASLNFLRYLLLRDRPEQNKTEVWSHIEILQRDYLTPLHKCLQMSQAQYALQLKKAKEEIRQAAHEKKNRKVKVCEDKYGQLPLPEQVKVLSSAQSSFDLIASILGRVEEIIVSVKRSSSTSKNPSTNGADSVAMDT